MSDGAKKIDYSEQSDSSFGDLPELLTKRADLATEISTLEFRLRDLANEIEMSQKNFESARADVEAEVRRAAVSQKADDAEGVLRRARIELEVADLEARRSVAERALDSTKLQLERLQQKTDESKNQHDAAQKRLKELISILDAVQAQGKAASEGLINNTRLVEENEKKLGSIQENIENLNRQAEVFKAELSNLEKQLQERADKLEDLTQQLVRASSERDEIEQRNSEAESRLAESHKARKELDEGFSKAQESHLQSLKALEANLQEVTASNALFVAKSAKDREAQSQQLVKDREAQVAALSLQRDSIIALYTEEARLNASQSIADATAKARETLETAEKKAEEILQKASTDYENSLSDALKSKAAADSLKAKAEEDYKSRIDDASREADAAIQEATADAEEILIEAKAKAESITSRIQADYDAKIAEGEKKIKAKKEEMEFSANVLLKEAERRSKNIQQSAKADADGIHAEVEKIRSKAKQDALTVIEKAKAETDVMRVKTDTYLQSLQRKADEEYDIKRRELDAKMLSLKASRESEISLWEKEQIEAIRASRRRHVEESSMAVVQLVQKQLTSSSKITLTTDEAKALYTEIDRSVRGILSSDNGAAKEKLKKLMEDPVVRAHKSGFKISKDTIFAVAVALFVISAVSGILIYHHFSRSSAGSDSYIARAGEERRASRAFNPPMSKEYRNSYTENVMYTTGYVKTELETQFQDQWIVSLNRFVVHKLDLSDRVVVNLVTIETGLLRRLDKMRAQVSPATEKSYLSKMTEAEVEVVAKMEKILGGPKNLQLFLNHKRTFYEENAGRHAQPAIQP